MVYGSAAGLEEAGSQSWDQNSPDVAGTAKTGDAFGLSVATGDTNGDGFDEISVGVPGKKVNGFTGAGGVVILPGSAAGTTGTGSVLWDQQTSGISEASGKDDNMGYAVALGDLTGDGDADLIAGVPGEDVGSIQAAGGANVLLGGAGGLSSTGDTFWSQNHVGVANTSETNDFFGVAVTMGDFNGDGKQDAGFGVSGENIAKADQGAVNTLQGAAGGLTTTGQHMWTQDSTDIKDTAETGDQFGYSLSTGQFGNGTQADLVVGVPFENIGSKVDGGAVNVLYGGGSGLSATGNQYWNQNSTDIQQTAETSDLFGYGLGSGPRAGGGASLIPSFGALRPVGGVWPIGRIGGGGAFRLIGR